MNKKIIISILLIISLGIAGFILIKYPERVFIPGQTITLRGSIVSTYSAGADGESGFIVKSKNNNLVIITFPAMNGLCDSTKFMLIPQNTSFLLPGDEVEIKGFVRIKTAYDKEQIISVCSSGDYYIRLLKHPELNGDPNTVTLRFSTYEKGNVVFTVAITPGGKLWYRYAKRDKSKDLYLPGNIDYIDTEKQLTNNELNQLVSIIKENHATTLPLTEVDTTKTGSIYSIDIQWLGRSNNLHCSISSNTTDQTSCQKVSNELISLFSSILETDLTVKIKEAYKLTE